MEEFALGWMGYLPDKVRDMDVNHIRKARKGRLAMLKAIFGDGSQQPQYINPKTGRPETKQVFIDPKNPPRGADGRPLVLSPKAFDKVFGRARAKSIVSKLKKVR